MLSGESQRDIYSFNLHQSHGGLQVFVSKTYFRPGSFNFVTMQSVARVLSVIIQQVCTVIVSLGCSFGESRCNDLP